MSEQIDGYSSTLPESRSLGQSRICTGIFPTTVAGFLVVSAFEVEESRFACVATTYSCLLLCSDELDCYRLWTTFELRRCRLYRSPLTCHMWLPVRCYRFQSSVVCLCFPLLRLLSRYLLCVVLCTKMSTLSPRTEMYRKPFV